MITILPFSRLTSPQVLEGGTDISLATKGRWYFEVRRTDGTIRLPFGDRWVDNVILNQFKDKVLSYGGFSDSGASQIATFLNSFFQHNTSVYSDVLIKVGTDSTPASATQTGLIGTSYTDNGWYSSGNSATVSGSTGIATMVMKKTLAVETGPKAYNEAVVFPRGYSSTFGPCGIYTAGLAMNRIKFPGTINLVNGDQLIITVAISVQTLAAATQTVTLSAQNGVNVSGQLKLVGTTAKLLGNTVSAGGVLSASSTDGAIFPNAGNNYASNIAPAQWYLSTASSHVAFNTTSPGLNTTIASSTTWGAYTTGNYYRDITGQWNSGGGDVAFRSISLLSSGDSYTAGYQLLLDNSQTKLSAGTLRFGLRFALA